MSQCFICLGFSVFQWKNHNEKNKIFFNAGRFLPNFQRFSVLTYNWLVVFPTEPNNAGYNGENCGQFLVDTVSGKSF